MLRSFVVYIRLKKVSNKFLELDYLSDYRRLNLAPLKTSPQPPPPQSTQFTRKKLALAALPALILCPWVVLSP